MKVKGLNNREYHLDLKKYIVRGNDEKKKSKYQNLARNLIKEIFIDVTNDSELFKIINYFKKFSPQEDVQLNLFVSKN